jgi:hypothetical protein
MLEKIDAADAVVLASPVNYYNVTAIFRKFLERLLGYAYWPWGQAAPTGRKTKAGKKAGCAGGFGGNAGVSDSAGDRRGEGPAIGGEDAWRQAGGQDVDRAGGWRAASRAIGTDEGAGAPTGQEAGIDGGVRGLRARIRVSSR